LPYTPDAAAACGLNAVNPTNDTFGHGLLDGVGIVAGQELADMVTGNGAGDGCEWLTGTPPKNRYFGAQYFALAPTWSNADSGCVYASPVPGSTPKSGRYVPLQPARILDTRSGGVPLNAAGPPLQLQVTNKGGVPANGVSAVVLNITVTNTASGSFLTAY